MNRRQWLPGERMMFSGCMAVLLCLVISPGVKADAIVQRQTDGPIDFILRVSDSETLIAEPLQVELEVIVPSELQVVLPALEESLGDWEIVAKEVREDLPHAVADGTNSRRWWMRLTLECLQTGEVEIPSIEVQTLPRQSESRSEDVAIDWDQAGSLVTQPISIGVLSVLSESADPMKPEPIADAIALPVDSAPSRSWLPAVVVGLVVMLVAGAIGLLRIRSRRGISDSVWARRRVADLQSQWQKQKLSADECVCELSQIHRDWIGSMMGRESAVSSEEALAWLQDSNPAIAGNLRPMLTRADEVSFAGISAPPTEADAWLNQSSDWMDQMERLQIQLEQEAKA
ncbi:hypothetical protein [Rhodopirellula bahusiensis]|uniref:hypothetical protein n=1 Tax=Rhodopirellula bahusiensis TaxID=2014065 RepID=UPI003298BD27